MTDTQSFSPSRDDFAALLDETLQGRDLGEGQVVHGRVVGMEKDILIIDVGLKTEGRIPAREFGIGEGAVIPKVGDNVEVYLERVENAMGEAVISREKARREEAWTRLEGVYDKNEPVMGVIVGRVDEITSEKGQAVIHLALDPEQQPLIAADVQAFVVPKTLFGEKFVDIDPGAHEQDGPYLGDGGEITNTLGGFECRCRFRCCCGGRGKLRGRQPFAAVFVVNVVFVGHQLFRMFSSPLTEPTFWVGCEALVFSFAFFGLRASLFDLCWPLAMVALLARADAPAEPLHSGSGVIL